MREKNNFIREAAKSHGLTLREVAEKMGITVVGISKHANGSPSINVLNRIAAAIGCDVAELVTPPEVWASRLKTTQVCPHCGKPIVIVIS